MLYKNSNSGGVSLPGAATSPVPVLDSSKSLFLSHRRKIWPTESQFLSFQWNKPTDLSFTASLGLVWPSWRADTLSGFHTESEGGKLEESEEEPGIDWEMNLDGGIQSPGNRWQV